MTPAAQMVVVAGRPVPHITCMAVCQEPGVASQALGSQAEAVNSWQGL